MPETRQAKSERVARTQDETVKNLEAAGWFETAKHETTVGVFPDDSIRITVGVEDLLTLLREIRSQRGQILALDAFVHETYVGEE